MGEKGSLYYLFLSLFSIHRLVMSVSRLTFFIVTGNGYLFSVSLSNGDPFFSPPPPFLRFFFPPTPTPEMTVWPPFLVVRFIFGDKQFWNPLSLFGYFNPHCVPPVFFCHPGFCFKQNRSATKLAVTLPSLFV